MKGKVFDNREQLAMAITFVMKNFWLWKQKKKMEYGGYIFENLEVDVLSEIDINVVKFKDIRKALFQYNL